MRHGLRQILPQQAERRGQSKFAVHPESIVDAGFVERLPVESDGGPPVEADVDPPKEGERLPTSWARRADGEQALRERSRSERVGGITRVVGLSQTPPPDVVNPIRRREPNRRCRQLACGVGRPSKAGLLRGLVEDPRGGLVRPVGGKREMAGTLLEIDHDRRESGMDLPSTDGRRRPCAPPTPGVDG